MKGFKSFECLLFLQLRLSLCHSLLLFSYRCFWRCSSSFQSFHSFATFVPVEIFFGTPFQGHFSKVLLRILFVWGSISHTSEPMDFLVRTQRLVAQQIHVPPAIIFLLIRPNSIQYLYSHRKFLLLIKRCANLRSGFRKW